MLHLHPFKRCICTIFWELDTVLLRWPHPAAEGRPSAWTRWERSRSDWTEREKQKEKQTKKRQKNKNTPQKNPPNERSRSQCQEMSEEREVKQNRKTAESGRLWRSSNCSTLFYMTPQMKHSFAVIWNPNQNVPPHPQQFMWLISPVTTFISNYAERQ